ncbi:hypothetical protein N8Z98_03945 [Planktomarina temperata]|nr:hypothetical protein [Planktomarina temperata]
MGLVFEAASVLRGEIRLEKAMILNVLTLPAARASQSLPKRGGDVSGHRNPLRGWAQ